MKYLLIIVSVILMLVALTSCGDKATTTIAATTSPAQTTVSPAKTAPAATETPAATQLDDRVANDLKVATEMADLLYDIEAVQDYYDDGMTAMVTYRPGSTEATASELTSKNVVFLSRVTVNNKSFTSYTVKNVATAGTSGLSKVPKEFLGKLPPSGAMPAPAGACPAAAEPKVTFKTAGERAVTPDLIEEKNINTIPSELVTVAQDDPNSLYKMIEEMVPVNDQSLATAKGWDNLLWSKLRAMQQPADSIMDYQLWNAENDIMQQITSKYRERLVSYGVPQRVLDAYDQSAGDNWYASAEPKPEDALARMDIEAKLTGSMNGTVYEQRDFSFDGASQTPIYGTQTGTGEVTWSHPALGEMKFDVTINLDKFDDMGRAIGGTAAGVNKEKGYEIRFTFLPDGTKDGVVLKDGEEVGQLTMTVDHEKFENYIDIKEGTEIKLLEDTKTLFQ